MKPKICHITTLHPWDDTRIFHKECKALAEAGFAVSLIVVNQKSQTVDGVTISNIDGQFSGRLEAMRKRAKLALARALEIDAAIYHLHDPELLSIAGKLKAKGKMVIYDAHEDVPRQILAKPWIPSLLRPSISKVFEYFENRITRKIDAVVAATPYIRDRFLAVNPRTVDICNFPKLSELPAATTWANKEKAFCYIGRMDKVRGVYETMEVLSNTKEVQLVLAGWFGEGAIEAELRQNPNWKKVDFLGMLDRSGVVAVLSRCKVGLVTLHPLINYQTSLPVKMFEYMAAGIPFVASDFTYWKEIIDRHECGLSADPLSPTAIAKQVNYLFENDEVAQQMGRNGRKAVEAFYNWEIEKEKLVQLYEQLLA